MNIHEYQAKALLKKYGIPLLNGVHITHTSELKAALEKLDSKLVVVKAQIHAGGRGKAGGVVLAKNPIEAERACEKILNSTLVTHQTGPKGQLVRNLYIEQGCEIAKEFYLSLLVDRNRRCLSFIASKEGGMDIEEVSAKHPERIFTVPIDPATGLQPMHIRKLSYFLGLGTIKEFYTLVTGLYKAFNELDCSLIEINPMVLTKDGRILALDCKMTFDDNALFRQSEVMKLQDINEEDPSEIEAREYELNYVRLDGTIGCMVNGAGLAMGTMDIIKYHGGEPANFLDVGGSATADRVASAFKIILRDTHVKAILINIFGGIMRCDVIAEGIVEAARQTNIKLPIIVRLQGTNRDLGKDILKQSGLSLITTDDLDEAARLAVAEGK
jgi:succinyl-CoA synthetase beta subunit